MTSAATEGVTVIFKLLIVAALTSTFSVSAKAGDEEKDNQHPKPAMIAIIRFLASLLVDDGLPTIIHVAVGLRTSVVPGCAAYVEVAPQPPTTIDHQR